MFVGGISCQVAKAVSEFFLECEVDEQSLKHNEAGEQGEWLFIELHVEGLRGFSPARLFCYVSRWWLPLTLVVVWAKKSYTNQEATISFFGRYLLIWSRKTHRLHVIEIDLSLNLTAGEFERRWTISPTYRGIRRFLPINAEFYATLGVSQSWYSIWTVDEGRGASLIRNRTAPSILKTLLSMQCQSGIGKPGQRASHSKRCDRARWSKTAHRSIGRPPLEPPLPLRSTSSHLHARRIQLDDEVSRQGEWPLTGLPPPPAGE